MKFDLERIHGIEGGNLVYSLWEGYAQKGSTKDFIDYLKARQFNVYNVHTSGHADIETLAKMADAVMPKHIVPIHTFKGSDYHKAFQLPDS